MNCCSFQQVLRQNLGWFLLLTWKNLRALLNSVQKFIEIQGWLLLTFLICLHNQLSSFTCTDV